MQIQETMEKNNEQNQTIAYRGDIWQGKRILIDNVWALYYNI